MPARFRTADYRFPTTGSYYYYLAGTVNRSVNEGQQKTCSDVTGNFHGVNPFESHSMWAVRGMVDGTQYNTAGTTLLRKLNGYPVDRVATARDPRSYYGALDIPGLQSAFRELLNSSSPSEPHVSLPTAIGELKDFVPANPWLDPAFKSGNSRSFLSAFAAIPSLVRAFGRTLLGWVANGYLAYRWVLKPMLSDLSKLARFVDAMEERWRYLARLQRGESVTRKVPISNHSATVPQTRAFLTTGQGFSAQVDWAIHYTSTVWGSARWKLAESARPLPTSDSLHWTNLVRNLVGGVTSFELLKTAWELTPWSWFADWFGNVGQNLALMNNSIQAYWGDACIMRTLTSRSSYTLVPGSLPSWASISKMPVEEYTIKQRFTDLVLWLPILPTSLPMLDISKWSILSALSASSVDRGLPAISRRGTGPRVSVAR